MFPVIKYSETVLMNSQHYSDRTFHSFLLFKWQRRYVCTAVINRWLTAVLLTCSLKFILCVLNFVKRRFLLDSPRADERSITHYGSVEKVYNKRHVNE